MNALVWADLDRDVVTVRGADAGRFLHSQLAQSIDDMAPGSGRHSLLLDPTGHVVALVRVVRHDDHLFTMDTDGGFGQAVIDRLRRFVLRSDVAMEISPWVVRGFRGPGVVAALPAGTVAVVAHWDAADGVDVIADRSGLPVVGEQTEPEHVSMMRVDARWPRMGVDILAGDLPATTGVLAAAVSFTKGCYPGQELVERMDSRGSSAPVQVRILDRQAVPVGSRLIQDGSDVGTVTSMGAVKMLARLSRNSTLGEPLQH